MMTERQRTTVGLIGAEILYLLLVA